MNVSPSKIDRFLFKKGIKKPQRMQFIEAYRRWFYFHKNPYDIERIWLGLGYPSQYKGPYFRTHDGKKQPRICHWWVLTKEGQKVFKELMFKFKPPTKEKNREILNQNLFEWH